MCQEAGRLDASHNQVQNSLYAPEAHILGRRQVAVNRAACLIFTVEESGFTFRETGGLGTLAKVWAFSTIDEAAEWLNTRHKSED